jgi:competence protein ComEA
LASGSRACDALSAAGGATKDACLDLVNLAAPVTDGQQLHIPSRAEVAAQSYSTAGGGPVTKAAGPLNLNRATVAQLTGLPGIGPVLAARVVAHRTAHGPFATVDDLLDVQGIGASKLADLRPLVTVSP